MVHAACEALGVPILTSERFEADDVIRTLTAQAATARFDVSIVTSDKDFYQLVGNGIGVFNPRDDGSGRRGGRQESSACAGAAVTSWP
jgi:DNA polymerase-1